MNYMQLPVIIHNYELHIYTEKYMYICFPFSYEVTNRVKSA